jgi:hypothetical protein
MRLCPPYLRGNFELNVAMFQPPFPTGAMVITITLTFYEKNPSIDTAQNPSSYRIRLSQAKALFGEFPSLLVEAPCSLLTAHTLSLSLWYFCFLTHPPTNQPQSNNLPATQQPSNRVNQIILVLMLILMPSWCSSRSTFIQPLQPVHHGLDDRRLPLHHLHCLVDPGFLQFGWDG